MRNAVRKAWFSMNTPRGVWNQQRAARCISERAPGTVIIEAGDGVQKCGLAISLYKGALKTLTALRLPE
eukprot:6460896-Amphidinium_carterae.1